MVVVETRVCSKLHKRGLTYAYMHMPTHPYVYMHVHTYASTTQRIHTDSYTRTHKLAPIYT